MVELWDIRASHGGQLVAVGFSYRFTYVFAYFRVSLKFHNPTFRNPHCVSTSCASIRHMEDLHTHEVTTHLPQ